MAIVFGFGAIDAQAIPAWGRKYETSCATCHVAFPKLNSFGKAFRANGFRMPAGDEDLTKIKDVPMGAEAWKRLWPKGIWPGAIPGNFPFAVLVDNQVNVEEGAEIKLDLAFPQSIQLLGGGTLGEGFGYYVGVNLLEGNEFGGLHRVFGQFDGIKGTTMANARFGFMEPRAVPFSNHRKLTLSNYFMNAIGFDLNTALGVIDEHGEPDEHGAVAEHGGMAEPEHGDVHGDDLNTIEIGGAHHGGGAGPFALSNAQRGLEWWGAHSAAGGGGLEYAFGVVNGNSAGNNEGTFDNNNFKDIYWRASWKFGGMGVTGTLGDDPAEPVQTEGWRDDSLTVGTFGYYGRTPYELSRLVPVFDEHGERDEHGEELEEHSEEPDEHGEGPPVIDVEQELLEGDESFKRLGADFNWLVGDLNLYGAFMYGRNDRLGFDEVGEEVDFKTWFIQGDYVILPWVIGALRYEKVDLPDDFLDIERVVPHITLLARANIKFVVEGQLYRNDSGRNQVAFNITFAF